ncbi:radical SAM protein [Flavisphingomonas formosensis]|uniref:radical SAM protein n=1 Tax=Flavisphingomonas formosensis TaxID=861534 RepID=UPI0018E06029|nr:radical SAM protein [Sphingomonas formosensis]
MADVTHAQIEPTTRCNFACGFCAGRSMRQGDLAWEAFVAFLDAHPGLLHVELQGEGEPLLHPRFFDMAAECRARGIAVGLITNGSLLDEERIERLLVAGLASIHISMESADPDQFRRIRGGKFAKVRQGIARLAARRRARGQTQPVIGLAVTVLRETIGALQGICDLYMAERLDGGLLVQPLQTMASYADRYDPAMTAQLLAGEDWRRFLALRAALGQALPVRRTEDYFYHALYAGFDPARATCPWLDHGAYLNATGTVTGCCFMKEETDAFAAAADRAGGDARRAALVGTLDRGIVPAACRGCSTAAAIVAARTVSAA